MSGTIQGCAMKSEAVSCRADLDGSITKWVCDGLGEDTDWVGECETLGIYLGLDLIAGIVFNNTRPNIDTWLTIYSNNKRWCTRRVLKIIFGYVFKQLKCKRCSLLVSKDNEASIKLVEGLGFIREGLLRQYRENGADCYIYGMLKSECKWSN